MSSANHKTQRWFYHCVDLHDCHRTRRNVFMSRKNKFRFYVFVLSDVLKPSITKLHPECRKTVFSFNSVTFYVIQQRILSPMAWDADIVSMNCPAQSPILNPIEHLWNSIFCKAIRNTTIKKRENLYQKLGGI